MPAAEQHADDHAASPRVTKRKLADAVALLDESLKQSVNTIKPLKRKRVIVPPTSTALLTSLLPPRPTPPQRVPPPASYTPLSLADLVKRISTFRLSTYSLPKPASLSPASLALHGWQNAGPGRERVQCVTCGKGAILTPPTSGGWSGPIGVKTREQYERLVGAEGQGHDIACPWRVRGCSRALYRIQPEGRKKVIEDIRQTATSLQTVATDIRLALSDTALSQGDRQAVVQAVQTGYADIASESAVLLALFGWTSNASISSPVLSCTLCARQVLATPYLSSTSESIKAFDLIGQHQAFCPFVDQNAGLGIPPTSASAVSKAGWSVRADVILRRDTDADGRRSSSESLRSLVGGNGDGEIAGDSATRKSGMVQSRELLSYVRNLLGSTARK